VELSSADIFRTSWEEGFFRCGRPHFWCKKHRVFWNLWCVRTDKRVEPFADKGGGGHSRFCAYVFYGRLLKAATCVRATA